MYIVIKNNDKFNFSEGKLINEAGTWFIKFHSDETFEYRLYTVFYDESAAHEYADNLNKDARNEAEYLKEQYGDDVDELELYRVIKLKVLCEGYGEKINLFPHVQ